MSSENPITSAYRASRNNSSVIDLFASDNSWKDFKSIYEGAALASKTVTVETIRGLVEGYKIIEEKWDLVNKSNQRSTATRLFRIKDQYEEYLSALPKATAQI